MNVSTAIAILPGFPHATAGNDDDTTQMPHPGPPIAGDAMPRGPSPTAPRAPERPAQLCQAIAPLHPGQDYGIIPPIMVHPQLGWRRTAALVGARSPDLGTRSVR